MFNLVDVMNAWLIPTRCMMIWYSLFSFVHLIPTYCWSVYDWYQKNQLFKFERLKVLARCDSHTKAANKNCFYIGTRKEDYFFQKIIIKFGYYHNLFSLTLISFFFLCVYVVNQSFSKRKCHIPRRHYNCWWSPRSK